MPLVRSTSRAATPAMWRRRSTPGTTSSKSNVTSAIATNTSHAKVP
jgi:hypothetical protein